MDNHAVSEQASELAGVLSVSEAGIPPSSEGDKETREGDKDK